MCCLFKICPYQWHNGICESTNKMIHKSARSVEPMSLLPKKTKKTYHTQSPFMMWIQGPLNENGEESTFIIIFHSKQIDAIHSGFSAFRLPFSTQFSLHPSYDPPASETDRLRTLLRSVATSRKRHRFRSLVSWVVARPGPNQRDVAS